MNWSHVRLKGPHESTEEGLVRLEADETKNRTARIFPFAAHPNPKGLLEAERQRVDGLQRDLGKIIPWVFPRDDGRQLGRFHKQWTSACRAAGVPGRVPQDLR